MALLNKVLQVAQSFGLNERDIRYLLINAKDFDDVSLSEFPTVKVGETTNDTDAITKNFKKFRRLAAYSRLKRELAAETNDVIEIFEANATTVADKLAKKVYPLIAKLTRRDEATIKATAEALVKAPGVPNFKNEESLWRLWKALQVVERFKVSPACIVEWAGIVNSNVTDKQLGFKIADGLKQAIKANFEIENWQRIAQPIFDKLRQRQRDALVSHIVHKHDFERMEQLYEYFLIDPGMEPVVQTSRIRLAISSLQLFIQRCLLNLEPKVHPSAILNAKWWEWMKRYRVWEANRKIFLFPENWLEPEFRDDKTHLFTELEGTLLQGDVSNDLVEDAFLNYLRKLDELARLDIVAMHIDEDTHILHVFGRTYTQPYKYFYRRYEKEMLWTPWEPVNVEIEGDHLAPVVWRDRLYLFWVTFIEKAKPKEEGAELSPDTKIDPPIKVLEAHLHWSEYIQGEWKTKESAEFASQKLQVPKDLDELDKGGKMPIDKNSLFEKSLKEALNKKAQRLSNIPAPDSKQVFIHVYKETKKDGEERGVFIHLGSPFNEAFYLSSRNSPVEPNDSYPLEKIDHSYIPDDNQTGPTKYKGENEFQVKFSSRLVNTITGLSQETPKTKTILAGGGKFTLLPANNNPTGLSPLEKQVFYQDTLNTFFVEPSCNEQTIDTWLGWGPKSSHPEPAWRPDRIKEKKLVASVVAKIPKGGDPSPIIADASILQLSGDRDWMMDSNVGISFDKVSIGSRGSTASLNVVKGAGFEALLAEQSVKF